MKTTLKPDIWPHVDIKIPWFMKLFETLVREGGREERGNERGR